MVVDGRVYVGVGYENPRLLALDAATGRILWEKPPPASVWGSAAIAAGRVYFGISSATLGGDDARRIGKVYCVSAKDGTELWTFTPDHGVAGSLVADGGDVFAGCWNGRLYCLDAATGRKKWQADLGGVVFCSPAVDGRLVHLGTDEGRILALRRDTGRTEWTLTLQRWLPEGTRILSSPALVNGHLYIGAGANLVVCVGRP